MKISNRYNLIITALVFFALGFFFQNISLQNSLPKNVDREEFNLYWDVWKTIEDRYPFEEPSQDDKRYESIKGLVSAYDDPYSTFFPPEDSKLFHESVIGEFAGIGVEIAIKDGYLVVVAPLKDSPADKAGVKAGDVIVEIDGLDISNKNIDQLTTLIRGDVGTTVIISVLRIGGHEPLDIEIERDIINVPIIDTKIINGVFVLSLYNFNQNSENQFRLALEEFKRSGSKYLLIDLYNNPGGFLSSSVDVSSYFIDQGKIVVKESFGDSGKEDRLHRSKGYNLLDSVDFELGVLINRGSASASEIVAGALQDQKEALIIGEKSYGKGSIQEVVEFDQDTSLRVTIGRWLTPNDLHISKQGITPDIPLTKIGNYETALKEAIKVLKTAR